MNKKNTIKKLSNFTKIPKTLKDIKKDFFFNKILVSNKAFFMIKYIINQSIVEEQNHYTINSILKDIIENEDYRSIFQLTTPIEIFKSKEVLKELPFLQELLNIGYLKYSSEEDYFKEELNKTFSNFELLNITITVSDLFIDFIENNNEIAPNKTIDTYEQYLIKYSELIKLKFRYFNLKNEISILHSPILKKIIKDISKIKIIINKYNSKKNPIEKLAKKEKLNQEEKEIILILLLGEINLLPKEMVVEDNLVFYKTKGQNIMFLEEIMINEKLIDLFETFDTFGNPINYYSLTDKTLQKLLKKKKTLKEEDKSKVNVKNLEKILKTQIDFDLIKPKLKLKELVLSKEVNELTKILINQLNPKIYKTLKSWKVKSSKNIKARILFSGLPGTGKTATSISIGNELSKYIVSFDCSKILSMYVGESEKNVKEIFNTYRKITKELNYYPILLLNEADQFLSSRSNGDNGSASQMHNQMQNIFLEEIEKFEGILIATTNLKENLDKAFSRRFNYKIDFKLPNLEDRKKIWNIKLNKFKLPYSKSFNINELYSYTLSGAQIELIIEKTAMEAAINQKKKITIENFKYQIEQEIKNSFESENKSMGFLTKT